MKKIYIAGPMSNKFLYNRPIFYLKHLLLKLKGCKVMNPAILPLGFSHQEYIEICYKMIDCCDCLLMIKGWEVSKGARLEYKYAKALNKYIFNYDGKCLHRPPTIKR